MTTTLLASFPSPAQGVWHLGPVPLRAYALFIIVGIIAALVIGDRRWEARGGERGVIYDIALWAVPFGLIGGRLYHVITDWQTYFGDGGAGPIAALQIWQGGLGIWGAVALGGVGAWIGCKRHGIPLPAFGDAIAPGIVLAQAIGRLGNYFNQELYGRPTDLPWGLEIFYRQDPSGIVDVNSLNGVSNGQIAAIVHPTFLYELLWNLLVFVALIYVDRRFKIGHGRLFALYVAGYCVGRFGVELLRSDFATQIAGIRINSFTATFVFIGAIVYFILAPKGREDPKTLGGDLPDDELVENKPEPAEVLAAAAATTGVVAAATVALREDGDAGKQPEPEVESEPVTAVVEPVESTDADDLEDVPASEQQEEPESEVEPEPVVEPESIVEVAPDEADAEAEVVAAVGVVTETDAQAEAAARIDEDHDPVDEDDLEGLQDDVAVVAVDGPVSEQQEELATDEPETEPEPEVEPEPVVEVAPDEADAEAEVVAAVGVVTETDAQAEAAARIDEDHDPVDEDDLEGLQDDVAVVAVDGPVSEQQEELATDEPETEPEPEVEPEPEAEPEPEVEPEPVVEPEPDEAEAADRIDEDDDEQATSSEASPGEEEALAEVGLLSAADEGVESPEGDAAAETAEPAATTPPVTPPVVVPPTQLTSRLGRLLRRRKR